MADQETPAPRRRQVIGTPALAETAGDPVPVNVFAQPAQLGRVSLKAPANSAPFVLDGAEYVPDEDGRVEVPHHHIERLRSHGFEAI